jgi:hypothetical protein
MVHTILLVTDRSSIVIICTLSLVLIHFLPPEISFHIEKTEWADNIKMDLGEIGWGGVDWIGLAQDRDKWRALVNSLMNLRVS